MSEMSINEAAKQYGIPYTTLQMWVADGMVRVTHRPARRGQKMLIDGAYVAKLAKHYVPGRTGRGARQRLREAVLS